MQMKQGIIYISILIVTGLFTHLPAQIDSSQNYAAYVNPFIGTDFRGNTYPGATVPFGMVQLSPDTHTTPDRSSGYRYDAKSILGFSHTHLSGTGVGDMLDLLIMPTRGKLQIDPGKEHNPDTGYRSRFSHQDESASAGYYSVKLQDYDILVELTATERVGFHRYTFPQCDSIHIIVDLSHRFHNDWIPSEILDSKISILNDSLITGYRRLICFATNRYFYFAAKFSKPFYSYGMVLDDQCSQSVAEVTGKNLKCYLNYSTATNEQILVKVGISAVSVKGALANLNNELPHWNFDLVKQQANTKWNEELSKIRAEFSNDDTKITFYTALYHTMLAPVLYCDGDGSYRGSDFQIHNNPGFDNYHIFSLWETFRALYPLFTILHPERLSDIIYSILVLKKESGYLPVWHLAANETNYTIGYHSIPVITDAYLKGIGDFDPEKAFQAMKQETLNSIDPESYTNVGLEVFEKENQVLSKTLFRYFGYIPFDKTNHSVSKTLEYAYNDWCLAQLAKSLGYEEDYKIFMASSANYKNIFDSDTGLMRGRSSQGDWRNPFDPFRIFDHFEESDYLQGSAWQYSWFVPHDIRGLIDLMGGKDKFTEQLDFFFNPTITTRTITKDVAGFVGRYAQGNEPDHHVAYLYNYINQPWKTQAIVRWIVTRLYSNTPVGLTGNDDCGQMSAWYIFSVLGFYPVNPCGGIYVIGSPMIKKATLNLASGKKFEIQVDNQDYENKYIQEIILNGQPYYKLWISHNEIAKGGILIYKMGKMPDKDGRSDDAVIPTSYYNIE